jgi:hypothetical protein
MKEVIFLGKRKEHGSPSRRWPGAHLAGTTHSNQKYAKRYGTVDDWHSWWDLHPFNPVPGYDGIKKRRPSTYRWYQSLPGPGQPGYKPLYLAELDPTIPAGVLFPKQQILEELRVPHETRRWFTCQVDLMMAYFIVQGYEHIILHGHGMKFGSSNAQLTHMIDHCGVLVWMTVARERGIKVTVVEPSWYVGPRKPYGISLDGWDSLR